MISAPPSPPSTFPLIQPYPAPPFPLPSLSSRLFGSYFCLVLACLLVLPPDLPLIVFLDDVGVFFGNGGTGDVCAGRC